MFKLLGTRRISTIGNKDPDSNWKHETWNCTLLRFVGYEYALLNKLYYRNFDVVALQETRGRLGAGQ